jgi:hypothetical protein
MIGVSILDNRLVEAGISIISVSEPEPNVFVVEYAPEATPEQRTQGEAIVAAFDAAAEIAAIEAATAAERLDLAGLSADITGELDWIVGAVAEIDTGLGIVDAATLAQLRVIVKGLMQNQRRVLLEQRGELRAWRYVIRRLA